MGYSVGGNIQANKNTLLKYGPPSVTANGTINMEGQPYGSFYLYQFAGIFQSADEITKAPKQQFNPQPGYMRFKDEDGNNTIDANDRVVVPGIYPKFDYSFNASASWKNFDITVFLYGSYGQKQLVNGWGIQPFDQGSAPTTDWLNAWTPANHSTTMPLLYLTTGSGPIMPAAISAPCLPITSKMLLSCVSRMCNWAIICRRSWPNMCQ